MMTTPDDAAAFATYAATLHERARLSRESAILARYGEFQMQRADVDVLEHLSSQIEDPRCDFSAAVMVRSR